MPRNESPWSHRWQAPSFRAPLTVGDDDVFNVHPNFEALAQHLKDPFAHYISMLLQDIPLPLRYSVQARLIDLINLYMSPTVPMDTSQAHVNALPPISYLYFSCDYFSLRFMMANMPCITKSRLSQDELVNIKPTTNTINKITNSKKIISSSLDDIICTRKRTQPMKMDRVPLTVYKL